MKRPDFLIIGAQKAGTTWLYRNLRKHPDVFLPTATELMFFNKPQCETPDLVQRYMENFDDADAFTRVGEKTPGYFWSTDRNRSKTQPPKEHNPDIPGSVLRVLGDEIDFIISFRHPVDRAISAFGHHIKRGRIAPDARLRDEADRFGILDIGHYPAHSRAWLNTFSRDRFHVLVFEDDVVADPTKGYRRVCEFLNVDTEFCPDDLHQPRNEGLFRVQDAASRKPETDDGHTSVESADLDFLFSQFENEIVELAEIWGLDLGSWAERSQFLQSQDQITLR